MKYFLSLILFITVLSPLTASEQQAPYSEKQLLGQIGFDKLRVEDIIIGIEPYEREQTQDLLIDMRVTFDLSQVSETDTLESTVNYVDLAELSSAIATDGNYYFIDVLGLDILKRVFHTYLEVEKACIRIQKEAAIPSAKSGGLVEISLTRDEFLGLENPGKIMGRIGFDQLLVHTVIGDLPVERANAQDLLVDVRVTLDLQQLEETGELQSTVSYVEMADLFEQVATEGQYQMIETLAIMYAKKLYQQYPQIEGTYVKIKKPGTLPSYPFKNDAVTELRL